MPWYVFDGVSFTMGHYDTEQEAEQELAALISEIPICDEDANPYIEFREEDYFNIEDFEYELYKWAEDSMLPTRDKKVKVRREWK